MIWFQTKVRQRIVIQASFSFLIEHTGTSKKDESPDLYRSEGSRTSSTDHVAQETE